MPRIYVSHRPEDSSHNDVPIILDLLREQFGDDNIFDTTNASIQTTEQRQILVQSCDVLLIIIGRFWTQMTDETGQIMLFDPYDPVNIEISTGLVTDMVITTIIVDGVDIPAIDKLPESIHGMYKKRIRQATDETLVDIVTKLMGAWAHIKAGTMAKQNYVNLATMQIELPPELRTKIENVPLDSRISFLHDPNSKTARTRNYLQEWWPSHTITRVRKLLLVATQDWRREGGWIFIVIFISVLMPPLFLPLLSFALIVAAIRHALESVFDLRLNNLPIQHIKSIGLRFIQSLQNMDGGMQVVLYMFVLVFGALIVWVILLYTILHP